MNILYNNSNSLNTIVLNDNFRELLYISPKPHSSISFFGKGVVNNYANNFGSKF